MIRSGRAAAALAAVLLVVLFGPFGGTAAAHPLQFSYIDINLTPTGCDVALTVHAFDAAHDLGLAAETEATDARFPDVHGARLTSMLLSRVTLTADGQTLDARPLDVLVVPDQLAVVVRLSYPACAGVSRLEVAGWLFPYDQLHQTFVKVLDGGPIVHQDILSTARTRTTYLRGSTQSRGETFRRFLASGIEHIAIGPDHVLFLIGLLLLGGSAWRLVRIVTAFTLAHSVTLSLAALEVVSPPARIVEPLIAVSICYVGLDNLLRKPESRDRRAWIAFGFGLIHGFGFANVLREIGLPRPLLGWSLFAFNAGVELGQLVIVAVVASLLAWIALSRPALRRRITVIGSVVVVWAGFFWLVERLFLQP